MRQQLMDARSCTGACETERGCSCWSGKRKQAYEPPQVPYMRELPYSHKLECGGACEGGPVDCTGARKCTEAHLDARRAEIEAATIARRQRYMAPLSDAALAQMASEDVITGPYRNAEPVTVTWRQKLARWWRRHVVW